MSNGIKRYVAGTRSPRAQGAFTITEMMVVTAIILILATVSIPLLAPLYERRALSQACDVFKQACVRARSRAIQEGKAFRVIVIREGGDSDSVQVQSADYATLPSGTDEEKKYKNSMSERKQRLPANTRFNLTAVNAQFPAKTIFDTNPSRYQIVFGPTGGITGDLGAFTSPHEGPGFGIEDTQREKRRIIYLFRPTGLVLDKEEE